VRTLNAAEPQFPGDDGAVDPVVAAALAAYAAGRGSEHAALTALATSRLLVPVVAVLTGEEGGVPAAGEGGSGAGQDSAGQRELRREKSSEMALPTLIGQDGRAAILAFTCRDALTRWRPDARPVPVPAARAWLAGTQDASAVVIDVAGPVPLAVEGARLAALAAGRPVPLPHQDPDVLAALRTALATEPLIAAAALTTPGQVITDPAEPGLGWPGATEDLGWLGGASPGGEPPAGTAGSSGGDGAGAGGGGAADGGEEQADLALRLTLADGTDPAAATAAVHRVSGALLGAAGGRLRRGIAVTMVPAGPSPRP
jgi:hypothetical protein